MTALDQETGCECPGAHECGVTTSTAANERRQAAGQLDAASAALRAERRVLDAMAKVDHRLLCLMTDPDSRGWLSEACAAELARREVKP